MKTKKKTTRRKKTAECPKIKKTLLQKPRKKKTGPKGPRLKLTSSQWKKIAKHAMAQCKDHTIALVMGIPLETFRENCREFTTQKRAEGKTEILEAQYKGAKKLIPSLTIWFGKQHLEQHDRLDIDAVVEGRPSLPIIVRLPNKKDEA